MASLPTHTIASTSLLISEKEEKKKPIWQYITIYQQEQL